MADYWNENEYEHIVGPDYEHTGGYHGDETSVEQIRGCTTAQCLVAKREHWQPSNDDLDFERHSAYHLTGLADCNWLKKTKFTPVLHGVDQIAAVYGAQPSGIIKFAFNPILRSDH